MAAMIDPSVIGQVAPVKMQSPLEAAQQIYMLKDLATRSQLQQGQLTLQQQNLDDQKTLADIYRNNTTPDGQLNAPGVVQSMGSRGLGHLIPTFQKNQQDQLASQAGVDEKKSITSKNDTETMLKKLDASASAIHSLLVDPNVSHDSVVQSVVQQVQAGLLDQEHGLNTIRSMPPVSKGPGALKVWLQEQGMKIMDASKRVQALTPNIEYKDTGKALQPVDTNALTNPNPMALRKTTTPGEDQSAYTQMRGQDIAAKTAASQIEQTPSGYVVVNKRDGQAIPVTGANGAPILQPNAPVYTAQQQFGKLKSNVALAKELLAKNPTHSGIGAHMDAAGNFLGHSTDSGDAAAQLEALGGWMTSNVPRMEGPQSDKDTAQYKIMAGQIGDRTIPISTRLAALQTVEELQTKYAKLNGGDNTVPVARPPLSAFRKP